MRRILHLDAVEEIQMSSSLDTGLLGRAAGSTLDMRTPVSWGYPAFSFMPAVRSSM